MAEDQDIGGLQVAVHDAPRVGVGQGIAQLQRNRLDEGFRKFPAVCLNEVFQRHDPLAARRFHSLGILHREVMESLLLARVMDRQNVGMSQIHHHPRLGAEAVDEIVASRLARQELQRKGLAGRLVLGEIDFSHPAPAQRAENAVLAQRGARPKRGRRRGGGRGCLHRLHQIKRAHRENYSASGNHLGLQREEIERDRAGMDPPPPEKPVPPPAQVV